MRAYGIKTNDKPFSKPITEDEKLRRAIATRLRPMEGPFRLREHGDPPGVWLPRDVAVDRITARTLHGPIGLATECRNGQGKGVLVRVMDVVVPSSVTNGNEKVDTWVWALNTEFNPGVLNYGVTVCKHIGSTGYRSQHTPWTQLSGSVSKAQGFSQPAVSDEGNAGDMAHAKGRVTMKKMWEFSLANRAELDICNLIHWPSGSPYPLIWNAGGGVHRYDVPYGGSDHSDHVHADFNPNRPYGGSVAAC
jgi:hypothetical protein